MTLTEELLAFIKKSPVNYLAAANAARMLEENGFKALREDRRWELIPGGSYYVIRNDSALLAFTIPEEFSRIRICASHADSPCFKLKENPGMERANAYVVLNVEKYGGALIDPWFDRPLSVAGRVFVRDEDRLVRRLVDLDRDILLIPSLAIHMNRNANAGVKHDLQQELLPLFALSGDRVSLDGLIADAAGCDVEDVAGSDLYVYNRQAGSQWGPKGEFISAPRLDDLQCAFTTLKGFLSAERRKSLCMYALFDNEEVGSDTRQGADSTFLRDILIRIYRQLGRDYEQLCMDLAAGLMISADNAHAVHPNYAAKADPVNRPVIGSGVVLKFSGAQRYCTDGYSAALFREICSKAGCRVQVFTNNSDIPGGSTLGIISMSHVSMPAVDIGLPQLAMHSPYETAGSRDGEDLVKISKEFFE